MGEEVKDAAGRLALDVTPLRHLADKRKERHQPAWRVLLFFPLHVLLSYLLSFCTRHTHTILLLLLAPSCYFFFLALVRSFFFFSKTEAGRESSCSADC